MWNAAGSLSDLLELSFRKGLRDPWSREHAYDQPMLPVTHMTQSHKFTLADVTLCCPSGNILSTETKICVCMCVCAIVCVCVCMYMCLWRGRARKRDGVSVSVSKHVSQLTSHVLPCVVLQWHYDMRFLTVCIMRFLTVCITPLWSSSPTSTLRGPRSRWCSWPSWSSSAPRPGRPSATPARTRSAGSTCPRAATSARCASEGATMRRWRTPRLPSSKPCTTAAR